MDRICGTWVECVVLVLSQFFHAEVENGKGSGRHTVQDREVQCEAYSAGQVLGAHPGRLCAHLLCVYVCMSTSAVRCPQCACACMLVH